MECRMQAYGFARRFDLNDGEEEQYVNLCCVVTDLWICAPTFTAKS
jgi:hypothetical protein